MEKERRIPKSQVWQFCYLIFKQEVLTPSDSDPFHAQFVMIGTDSQDGNFAPGQV